MNNEEEYVPAKTERTGNVDSPETVTVRRKFTTAAKSKLANKRLMIVAFAVSGVAILALFLFWLIRSGDGGRPVPAPRNTSFGAPDNTGVPAGEATITISPEQVERAGIKTETVGEQLSTEGGTTLTTGIVQANAYRETPVITVVGGIVRKVNRELGQEVRRGTTLAVISSEELSQAESRYLTLLKDVETARQNYQRETRLVRISPVSSAELDAAAAKLKTDEAELDESRRSYERAVRLVEIGATSREDLERSHTKMRTEEAEVAESRERHKRALQIAEIDPASRASFEQAALRMRNAEAELSAVRERLLILGLPRQRINSLRSPNQVSSELPISSPLSGTVTSRSVNRGEVIEANKELLRVTDLSTVWVIAQVYESDLARMRIGSGASVTSNSYPNQVFRGHVTYIDPNINQETRTLQVRVELGNPRQTLKIGMYVNVAFGSVGDAERTMPVVPATAVQNVNNQQVVFLATEQPNVFIMRSVRLVSETGGFYPVIEGVTVGDRVVTEGSFLLRAEWLKLHPNGS